MIEDDADTRANLRDILELDDHRVATAGSAAEAMARDGLGTIRARSSSTAGSPTRPPSSSCPASRPSAPDAAVIVVTGYADLQGAIAALRQGATDYILKPLNAGPAPHQPGAGSPSGGSSPWPRSGARPPSATWSRPPSA